jgi:hypothetical protein
MGLPPGIVLCCNANAKSKGEQKSRRGICTKKENKTLQEGILRKNNQLKSEGSPDHSAEPVPAPDDSWCSTSHTIP